MPEHSSTSGAGLLAPEALDFAPDLLAIQERPPARLPRAIGLTVVALIGLLLLWALIAKLDIIASAEGRLVPVSFTKVVQPAEAGVITEIRIKDGDLVSAGQILMRLDARLSQADVSALKSDVGLKKLTLRRIEAERGGSALHRLAGDPADLFAQVEAQYRAHRQAYADSLAQENETLNKLQSDLVAAEQVEIKLRSTLPAYRKTAEAYDQLKLQGFVGELAATEKQRDLVEHEQDLKAQTATVSSTRSMIAQSRQKLAGIRSNYLAQLENERVEVVGDFNKVTGELSKSEIHSGQLVIRAPHAGVVKDLATTTRGAVVSAGALLMNIVPRDEPLQAEVLLKNEDVGFVSVGQDVKIKIATYPFQKYGMLEGKVALVSADSSDAKQDPQTNPSPLSYKALVRLASTSLKMADGQSFALSPGMLVTAEIHQGRRSVMEYLLSPVKKLAMEAARER